jgi:hypothetical protein
MIAQAGSIAAGLLADSDQFVAAGAPIRLAGLSAMAFNLDANPAPAAFVATGQQGPFLVIGHGLHPYLCREPHWGAMVGSAT